MRYLSLILVLILTACFAEKDGLKSYSSATKVVFDKNSHVEFKIPESWEVTSSDESKGVFVMSKGGNGFEQCRIGKIKVAADKPENGLSLAELDQYFLANIVKIIEAKGKYKFIENKVEILEGMTIGATYGDLKASGVVVKAFVKNVALHENQNMTFYVGYPLDIENRLGVECSMLGKDRHNKLLGIFKDVAASVKYRNEYYKN